MYNCCCLTYRIIFFCRIVLMPHRTSVYTSVYYAQYLIYQCILCTMSNIPVYIIHNTWYTSVHYAQCLIYQCILYTIPDIPVYIMHNIWYSSRYYAQYLKYQCILYTYSHTSPQSSLQLVQYKSLWCTRWNDGWIDMEKIIFASKGNKSCVYIKLFGEHTVTCNPIIHFIWLH